MLHVAKIDKDMNDSNKGIIKWFVQFTSIGGFTQTRDSDNWISRIIWAILFLTGLVLTIVGMSSVIIQYCQFRSVTNIQLRHSSSGMPFPSITVCNTNRIHCGHLYDKIISCQLDPLCTRETLYCEIFVLTQCSVSLTIAHALEYGERRWQDICLEHFNQLSSDQYKEIEKIYHANDTVAPNILYDMAMKLTADEMEELAHRPNDMIKECHWNGVNDAMCRAFIADGGTKIFVPKFGICYALNFKGTDDSIPKPPKVHHAGSVHGLKLIFDIQSEYHMRNGMTEKQGIYAAIGNRDQLPNVVSEAIPLHPKTSTELGLTVKNIVRLKDPYPSKCVDQYPEMYRNMTLKGTFDFLYSEKTCQSMCANYQMHKYCGCYNPQLIEGNLGWRQYLNSSFCEYNFTKTDPCIDKAREVLASASEADNVCQCFPECRQSIYKTQIATTMWPSDSFLPKVAAKYGKEGSTQADYVSHELRLALNNDSSYDSDGSKDKLMTQYMEYVSKNLLEVNVFFTSLTYENIVEIPEMTISQMMGNLGGAISLYLGVSFVAAFEVFELIIRLIVVSVLRKIK